MQGINKFNHRNKGIQEFQGFGVIEVLIALVVISVGALGLARAQIVGVRLAQDAGMRTAATMLLQDMAARIQANSGEGVKGLTSAYRNAGSINNNCFSTTGNISTGAQMAVNDIGEWNEAITRAFPSGTAFGLVCLEATPGSKSQTCGTAPASNPYPVVFTLKIFWKSWANRGTASYDQYVVSTVEPFLSR